MAAFISSSSRSLPSSCFPLTMILGLPNHTDAHAGAVGSGESVWLQAASPGSLLFQLVPVLALLLF